MLKKTEKNENYNKSGYKNARANLTRSCGAAEDVRVVLKILCVLCGLKLGELRSRSGKVFGCGADIQRGFGQGGGKPPHSPKCHTLIR